MEIANVAPANAEQPLAAKVGVTAWGVKNPLVAGAPFEVNVSAKALDGLALGEVRFVVVDEGGEEVASVPQEAPALHICQDSGQSGQPIDVAPATAPASEPAAVSAVVSLSAPRACGPHAWKVELRRAGETLAGRPIPLSVTPPPSRPALISVRDAQTGKALCDASVFFYNDNLSRVKPLSSVSDESGVARAVVVADAPYTVRVECLDHDEGTCSIAAGPADAPAEASVFLARSAFEEENLAVMHGSVARGRR